MPEPQDIVAQELTHNAAQLEIIRCVKALTARLRYQIQLMDEGTEPNDQALLIFNQRLQPLLQAAGMLRELNYFVTTMYGCGHNHITTNANLN